MESAALAKAVIQAAVGVEPCHHELIHVNGEAGVISKVAPAQPGDQNLAVRLNDHRLAVVVPSETEACDSPVGEVGVELTVGVIAGDAEPLGGVGSQPGLTDDDDLAIRLQRCRHGAAPLREGRDRHAAVAEGGVQAAIGVVAHQAKPASPVAPSVGIGGIIHGPDRHDAAVTLHQHVEGKVRAAAAQGSDGDAARAEGRVQIAGGVGAGDGEKPTRRRGVVERSRQDAGVVGRFDFFL